MNDVRVIAVVGALVVLAAGCGSPPVCAPGATQMCVCPGSPAGAQTCAPDGRTWLPCQCAAPLMPAEVVGGAPTGVPAPMQPVLVPTTTVNAPAPTPAEPARPLRDIVVEYRPSDAAPRFMWISSADDVRRRAQLHCEEHAVEAARRAVRIFTRDDYVCENEECHLNHDGNADPRLFAEQDGDGVRLTAYWNGLAGDASRDQVDRWRRELACGQTIDF